MEVNDELTITDSIKIKSRTYLSLVHIRGAALFSRNSAQIEKEYDGNFSDELYSVHRSYIMGSILSSVSFLEASVNEFLSDTLDHPEGEVVRDLDATTKTLLAKMWKEDVIERMEILNKFQITLTIARKELFESGTSIFQDVDYLIKLRNALVHYKPTWIESSQEPQDQRTAHKIEKILRGKFPLNPLTGAGNPFYPDKCLSHGCSKWAVTSSIKFIETFYTNLGISYPFNYILQSLKIS